MTSPVSSSAPVPSAESQGPRGRPVPTDPLDTLRAYHALAPWSLRDLAGLAATLLEASGVVPVNAAARARPTERTIRFYVSRGLVDPPDGRGTAAVYRYRHLLQVLAIKLRQMEGVALEAVGRELTELTGDTLERRVAGALGSGIPAPGELGPLGAGATPRGRTARALKALAEPGDPEASPAPVADMGRSVLVRRLAIAPGAELSLDVTHPLFRHTATDDTVIRAVARVLDQVRRPGDEH